MVDKSTPSIENWMKGVRKLLIDIYAPNDRAHMTTEKATEFVDDILIFPMKQIRKE